MADYLNTGDPTQDANQLLIEKLRRMPQAYQGATDLVQNAAFPQATPYAAPMPTSPTGHTASMDRMLTGRTAVPKPGMTVPGTPSTPVPATSVAEQWNTAAASSGGAAVDAKNQQLYDMLLARAQQGLNPDMNSGPLRVQADAYTAGAERAKRSYLADAAESLGPGANMLGESRLANEKMAQDVGGFRAQLVGQEISARRQEIAGALSSMGSMLSTQQQAALQRELAHLDYMQKQRELDITEADRKAYYDALKRGLYKD